jgi:hypothetical protein
MKARWAFLSLAAALAATPALAAGPFSAYAGSWRGTGQLDSGGRSERLSCRSDNSVSDNGAAVSLSLVCASDSFRLDIHSDLTSDGRNVQGTWTETTQNVSGDVTGVISKKQIDASVSSNSGFTANIALRAIGRRLDVSLASQQGNVQVVMHR